MPKAWDAQVVKQVIDGACGEETCSLNRGGWVLFGVVGVGRKRGLVLQLSPN